MTTGVLALVFGVISIGSADTLESASSNARTCAGNQRMVHVVDSHSGRPISNASLRSGPSLLVHSDAMGRCCIEQAAVDAEIEVSHPRYFSSRVRIGGSPTVDPLKVMLAQIARVEVRVRNGSSSVPAAALLWRAGAGPAVESSADESGRWRSAVERPGLPFVVAAKARGYPARCAVIRELDLDNSIEIGLDAAAVIKIRVLTEQGEPLKDGAIAWLADRSSDRCPDGFPPREWDSPSVRLEADSAWTVTGIPSGTGVLRVSAPGYRSRETTPVAVIAGTTRILPDLELATSEEVRGVVLTHADRPAPGVLVAVFDRWGDRELDRSRTDESGRFNLDLETTETISIRAGAPPGPSTRLDQVTLNGEEIRIRLPKGASIRGHVRDSEGSPLPGVLVEATPPNDGSRLNDGSVRVITDERGAFRLDGLGDGNWKVECRKNGLANYVERSLRLSAGMEKVLQIAMQSGRRVEGRVLVRDDRTSVAGVEVRAGHDSEDVDSVLTDESGRFSIVVSCTGRCLLIAESPDGWMGRGFVEADEETIELLVDAAGAIEGQAMDAEGVPLSGHRVEIEPHGLRSETDPQGRFEFDLVPPGRVRLVLWRQLVGDRVIADGRDLEVGPGERLEVVLEPGVSVEGDVSYNGRSVGGAVVTFTRMPRGRPSGNPGETVATTETSADGHFTIPNLRAGTYTASARFRGVQLLRAVTVDPNRSNGFRLAIAGRVVRGSVVEDATNAPVRGAKVVVFDAARSSGPVGSSWVPSLSDPIATTQVSDRSIIAVTDSLGEFETTLPIGAIRIEAGADGFEISGMDLQVEDRGVDPALSFRLRRQRIARGVVRDGFGRPIAGAVVGGVCIATHHTELSTTDHEGFFELDNLDDGQCEVIARSSERMMGRSTVPMDLGNEPQLVDVVLQPAATIRVKLMDQRSPSLLTVNGVDVGRALDSQVLSPLRPALSQGSDGTRFLVWPSVPPGHYALAAGDASPVPFVAAPGEQVDLDSLQR